MLVFTFWGSLQAQVKIGGVAEIPHSSAVLELDGGNNRGLLLPRMRKMDIDAIQNPAEGLAIYATDEQAVYLRKSLVWEKQIPFSLPYVNNVHHNGYAVFLVNTGGPGIAASANSGNGIAGSSDVANGVMGSARTNVGIGGRFANGFGGAALVTELGRTGLGITAPTALLHLDGKNEIGPTMVIDDDDDPTIQFRKSGNNVGFIKNADLYMESSNSEGSFVWMRTGQPLHTLMSLRKKSGTNGKGVLNVSTSVSVGSFGGEFPAATLHVRGTPEDYNYTMLVQQSGGNPLIALQNDGLDKGFLQLVDNDFKLGTFATNNLGNFVIRTNGNDRIVVRPDGKMVLGSPTGSAPVTNHLLAVKGRIAATEFTVTNVAAWPDYVFANDYKLWSLEETEAFIKANKHLPNMPAAAVVEKDGYDMGDMQKRMMEKIEELTLHLIEANKSIQHQQMEIDALKKKMDKPFRKK